MFVWNLLNLVFEKWYQANIKSSQIFYSLGIHRKKKRKKKKLVKILGKKFVILIKNLMKKN